MRLSKASDSPQSLASRVLAGIETRPENFGWIADVVDDEVAGGRSWYRTNLSGSSDLR